MSQLTLFFARFKEMLRRWLRPAYVWKRVTHQLLAKVISFLLALGLWFFATNERRAIVEQVYSVPLTVLEDASPQEATDDTGQNQEVRIMTLPEKDQKVMVKLKGRSDRLKQIEPTLIEASVDLTNVSVTDKTFDVPITVVAPANTEVAERKPERVQGNVDVEVSRDFAVTIGTVAQGLFDKKERARYVIEGAQVVENPSEFNPFYVRVRGAEKIIDQVQTVVTLPIRLLEGQKHKVSLIALDQDGQRLEGVDIEPDQVILERLATKLLRVAIPDAPKGYVIKQVQLIPEKVRVVSRTARFNQLEEIQIKTPINPQSIKNGIFQGRLSFKVPQNVILLDKEVKAKIKIDKIPPVKPPASEEQNKDSKTDSSR